MTSLDDIGSQDTMFKPRSKPRRKKNPHYATPKPRKDILRSIRTNQSNRSFNIGYKVTISSGLIIDTYLQDNTLFQVRNLVARRRHGDTHEPAGDIGGVEEESQRGNFDRGERSVLAPQRMHFRERRFAARFQRKRDYFVVSQLTKS